jgi:sRNA-binding regulator protein Hfq
MLYRGDSLKNFLQTQNGKTVTLKLASGEEIQGVVSSVDDHVLYLSKLAGKEFYDALVRLEAIAAVVFKVR